MDKEHTSILVFALGARSSRSFSHLHTYSQAPFIRVAGRCVLKLSVRQVIDVNYISRREDLLEAQINRGAKKRKAFPRDNFDKKEHFSLYLNIVLFSNSRNEIDQKLYYLIFNSFQNSIHFVIFISYLNYNQMEKNDIATLINIKFLLFYF